MTTDVEAAYADARSFDAHRSNMRIHGGLFDEHYEQLGFVLATEGGAAPLQSLRILVLTEDYCIDSVLNLPLVARLSEASPGSELRIASRDEHSDLAARFPGRGGVSRLPTVIFLGAPQQVLGYWSERSQVDHAWMERFGASDPMPELVLERGRPTPELAEWMERRMKAQAPVYRAHGWRFVRDELVATAFGGPGQHRPTLTT